MPAARVLECLRDCPPPGSAQNFDLVIKDDYASGLKEAADRHNRAALQSPMIFSPPMCPNRSRTRLKLSGGRLLPLTRIRPLGRNVRMSASTVCSPPAARKGRSVRNFNCRCLFHLFSYSSSTSASTYHRAARECSRLVLQSQRSRRLFGFFSGRLVVIANMQLEARLYFDAPPHSSDGGSGGGLHPERHLKCGRWQEGYRPWRGLRYSSAGFLPGWSPSPSNSSSSVSPLFSISSLILRIGR